MKVEDATESDDDDDVVGVATAPWPAASVLHEIKTTTGPFDCCCDDARTAACAQDCDAMNCTAGPLDGCTDCMGNDCLQSTSALGDGVCDAGDGITGVDFSCMAFGYDGGDCPVPLLDSCAPRNVSAAADCDHEAHQPRRSLLLLTPEDDNAAGDANAVRRQLVVGGEEVCPAFAYSGFLVGVTDGPFQPTAHSVHGIHCGGTLLDRGHVLTAASCVCFGGDGAFNPDATIGLAVEVRSLDGWSLVSRSRCLPACASWRVRVVCERPFRYWRGQ